MKNKLMILLFIVLLTSFAAAFEMDISSLQDRPVQTPGFDFTDLLADEYTSDTSTDLTEQLTDTSQEPIIDTSIDEFGYAILVTHPQEFLTNNKLNPNVVNQFEKILSEISKNYRFITINNLIKTAFLD